MKLKFTKKMILESIEENKGSKTINFASYLKEGFIEKFLKISIENNKVLSMYFSSNDYGTATWLIKKGFVESHRWETEDDLKEQSYLSRHYPSPLEDGMMPMNHASEKIVPDVLSSMIDKGLSQSITKILDFPNKDIVLDWDEIIPRNKKLSDDLIEELGLKHDLNVKKVERPKSKEKKDFPNITDKGNFSKAFIKSDSSIFEDLKEIIAETAQGIKTITKQKIHKIFDTKIMKDNTKEKDSEDIKKYIENAKKISKRFLKKR